MKLDEINPFAKKPKKEKESGLMEHKAVGDVEVIEAEKNLDEEMSGKIKFLESFGLKKERDFIIAGASAISLLFPSFSQAGEIGAFKSDDAMGSGFSVKPPENKPNSCFVVTNDHVLRMVGKDSKFYFKNSKKNGPGAYVVKIKAYNARDDLGLVEILKQTPQGPKSFKCDDNPHDTISGAYLGQKVNVKPGAIGIFGDEVSSVVVNTGKSTKLTNKIFRRGGGGRWNKIRLCYS